MSHRKQTSKRKLAPTLGAAGLSLSLAGGVSAAAAPTADIQTQNTEVSQEITLYEEEISDVGLGTFSAFDKEKVETSRRGLKFAAGGCGCGQASDIRLKRDITQVGEVDGGINLYRYRYLWSDTVYVGGNFSTVGGEGLRSSANRAASRSLACL